MIKSVRVYKPQKSDTFLNLKQGQSVLIDILSKFDSFCKEYGIEYFLLWGTLLGAKRNGGIIPWDDDIDIGVTEENQRKIFENVSHLKDYGIEYLHYSKNSKMYTNEMRIYFKGYYKIQESNMHDYMTPMCIDIFVANKISTSIDADGRLEAEKKFKSVISKLIKKEAIWKSTSTLKFIARMIKRAPLLCLSTKRLHRKLAKLCEELYKGGDYQYCFPETLHNQNSYLRTYDKTFFEKVDETKFEHLTVKVPSNSEHFLDYVYGDWRIPKDRSSGQTSREKFVFRKDERI